MGRKGVLMDRNQVWRYGWSLDEGPVMVDYVIMRRGERGRLHYAAEGAQVLVLACRRKARKTNKTEEGERGEEEGAGDKTGERETTLPFLSQPKPQDRNSKATQGNAGTEVEDDEEEGQAKEEESGEANSTSSSSQSSLTRKY